MGRDRKDNLVRLLGDFLMVHLQNVATTAEQGLAKWPSAENEEGLFKQTGGQLRSDGVAQPNRWSGRSTASKW